MYEPTSTDYLRQVYGWRSLCSQSRWAPARSGHVLSECKAGVELDDYTSGANGGRDMVLELAKKATSMLPKHRKLEKKILRGKATAASDARVKASAVSCARDFVRTTIGAQGVRRDNWILYSSASRHPVDEEPLLVRLKVLAIGADTTVILTDVYLAPRLSRTIVSYGKIERGALALIYDGDMHSVT
uniref:Uncharacterized protein n=1 Tax=Peronospora matthiolae TaxID=2874970 RepID=A0AAV1T2V7_9STRA